MHRFRERGQVLILLATWLFFGGGAASALVVHDRPVSQLRKLVRHALVDAGRRDQILADLARWDSIQRLRDQVIDADRDALLGKLRRQESRISDIEPLTAKLDRSLEVMDREFLDLRFRVKEHLTREEWAMLTAPPGS